MCGPQTSETGNFRQIGFCSGVRNDESYTFLDTASQRGMTEGVPPHPDAGSTNKRDGKFSAIGIPLRCVERRALPFLGYRVAARYDRGCHPAPRCGVHKQARREILGNRDSAQGVERRALPFSGYRVAARYDRGCHPAPRCGVHKEAITLNVTLPKPYYPKEY